MPSAKAMNTNRDRNLGLLYLGLNLIISVASQFVLKAGMAKLGEFELDGAALSYLVSMINFQIIGGLILYALGTVLWLMCLSKLELSFAYPAATVQYLLVFAGAWLLFNEEITEMRMAGLAVITAGVIIMSLDKAKK